MVTGRESPGVGPTTTRQLSLGCLAAVGVGAALRFGGLTHQSLWFDEVFSLLISTRPPFEIWRLATGEFHPPGYHLLLHAWSLLVGTGEVSGRSFSALAGVLIIPAVWAAGRSLPTPDWSSAAGGWWVATSPLLVEYSQEARVYSLAALLAVLTWQAQEWAVRRGARHAWAVFAVLGAAGLMLHYYFGFVLLGLAFAFIAGGPERRSRRRWAAAQVGILLLFTPWLSAFGHQIRMAGQDFPYRSVLLYDVAQTMKNLAVRYPFLGFMNELISWRGAIVGPGVLLSGWLILLALRRVGWQRIRSPFLLVVVPLLGSLVVSLRIPLHHFHFFVIVAPFCAVLLAAGIGAIRTVPGRTLALAGMVTVNLISVGWYYLGPERSKADVRGAAAYLADGYQEGDWIVHGSIQTFFPSWYYHGGRLPEVAVAEAPVPAYNGGNLLDPANRVDPGAVIERAHAYTRLWYVVLTPTRGRLAAATRRGASPELPGWHVVHRQEFYWVTVIRLERQASEGRPTARPMRFRGRAENLAPEG